MKKLIVKAVLVGIAIFICFGIGAAVASYVISGLLIIGGFIALVESISWLKQVVTVARNLFDLLFFGAGAYFLVAGGVTIGIAISVAGLLFTLLYKPYLAYCQAKS